ncbi:hypothetical protein K3495_g11529 [Podosphaera aphanis]|nr:hypothetical protein K3495_g11529 [Podosphaera aphanis]
MKNKLAEVDLIIECRDYRVPLTSRNPLFEQSLAGINRVIVYTKRDLGNARTHEDRIREEMIRGWHHPQPSFFTNYKQEADIKSILSFIRDYAVNRQSILPARILVTGMPNVGKSSLLNALRNLGVHKPKAASTGAQPGITRKVANAVKIVERDDKRGFEDVYLIDTPGVFVPYVSDVESMLKLALVGCVKDNIIAPVIICDYLLFHLNKEARSRFHYKEFCTPTNDISEFLEAVCRRTGKLGKGGVPDTESAASWIIQRWRQGKLGTLILDTVEKHGLESKMNEEVSKSLNQARKQAKDAQRQRSKLKQTAF